MACVYMAQGEGGLLHLFLRISCAHSRRADRDVFTRRSGPLTVVLLSNAESAEDQIQDIVGCGRSGDGIERSKSAVEIEKQHLVRNLSRDRRLRRIQRRKRILDQPLMAHVGYKSSFGMGCTLAAYVMQNCRP